MWRRAALLVVLLLTALWLFWRPVPVARDIALPMPLGGGPLRITVFGTSLSAPPQTWPEGLAQRLTACRAAEVSVTRVAGPGMGSTWALDQIARVVETAPDLILIEFAINDADWRDGISLQRARSQHRKLIDDLRAALPRKQIALMTMSPAHGPRAWVRPRLATHYAQYHDLAQKAGTGLIDLYPRWLALPRGQRGLEADGLHPDPAVVGQILPDWLGSYLGCSTPA